MQLHHTGSQEESPVAVPEELTGADPQDPCVSLACPWCKVQVTPVEESECSATAEEPEAIQDGVAMS
jgi:hypothetical protein